MSRAPPGAHAPPSGGGASVRPRRRTDLGRLFARLLCAVFALVGVVPFAGGALVRARFVQDWASRQISQVLASELGVSARFDLRVEPWPLRISLENVEVDATDGGGPFLTARAVEVRPRIFSLVAGKVDAGSVEVLEPRLRAVIRRGELANLAYKAPAKGGGGGPTRAPLAALSISDARVDVTVDDARLVLSEIDVDLTTEAAPASDPLGFVLEIALRSSGGGLASVGRFHRRADVDDAAWEDRICRLDLRARVGEGGVLVRRLAFAASADFDPDPGTAPPCVLAPSDWRKVELELGALRVTGLPGLSAGPSEAWLERLRYDGRVHARAGLGLLHRAADRAPTAGFAALDLRISGDASLATLGPDAGSLPSIEGTIHAERVGVDLMVFATRLDAKLRTTARELFVEDLDADWADGHVGAERVTVRPFAPGVGFETTPVDVRDVEFTGLMRDLGVHPQAWVGWSIKEAKLDGFRGRLVPPDLSSPIEAKTRDFGVYDRPAQDLDKRRFVGTPQGVVRGTFKVSPTGIVLSNMLVDTGRTKTRATVFIGFLPVLGVDVQKGSVVDLADLSPLADIKLEGVAAIEGKAYGPYSKVEMDGWVGIKNFVFGGFPIGELERTKYHFEPLLVRLEKARVRHDESLLVAKTATFDFARPDKAVVVADADVEVREAPFLRIRDLFEILRFDKDRRWDEIDGLVSGTAKVHYSLGGREDVCGGGYLTVSSALELSDTDVFGERFDAGSATFDLVWDDLDAGGNGMQLDLRSATLRKAAGSVLLDANVQRGGAIRGNVVVSGLPISKLDALGAFGTRLDGSVGLFGEISGSLGAMRGDFDVRVGSVRIGPSALPASALRVEMLPGPPARPVGITRCKHAIYPPYTDAEFLKDTPDGEFRVSGKLLGGQIKTDGLSISRQRAKKVKGDLALDKLDLGSLANLAPGLRLVTKPPTGSLSARVAIESLPLQDLSAAKVDVKLDALTLQQGESGLALREAFGDLSLSGDRLKVPRLALDVRTQLGLKATVDLDGSIKNVSTQPVLDLDVLLRQTDLAAIAAELPGVTRAGGKVSALVNVTGPPSALRYSGMMSLRGGTFKPKAYDVTVSDMQFDLLIDDGEAKVEKGTARVGSGTLAFGATVPIRGTEIGDAALSLSAKGVKIPVAQGISLTADAELGVDIPRASADAAPGPTLAALPKVKGEVSITQFSYTRPIALSLNLGDLIPRPQRSNVETYDPAGDVVAFDINVVAKNSLKFSNNLVDLQLDVAQPGLAISGTNQRYGARGELKVGAASKLKLRQIEFDVREGTIRFDDPAHFVPKVDVRAVTEYRRYATAGAQPATAAAQSAALSGVWRITLRATGEPSDLTLGMTSDPPLAQDDILLLLTTGMTRAELDRSLASSLGETVGLEALSSLTGVDRAVKNTIPFIDEFRFGSTYSTRSGRTEPSVTLGKRITDSLRANVTTTVSENREVRSNIEWRIDPRFSIQGAYDNVNDSAANIGNVGVDLRWRLEFE